MKGMSQQMLDEAVYGDERDSLVMMSDEKKKFDEIYEDINTARARLF